MKLGMSAVVLLVACGGGDPMIETTDGGDAVEADAGRCGTDLYFTEYACGTEQPGGYVCVAGPSSQWVFTATVVESHVNWDTPRYGRVCLVTTRGAECTPSVPLVPGGAELNYAFGPVTGADLRALSFRFEFVSGEGATRDCVGTWGTTLNATSACLWGRAAGDFEPPLDGIGSVSVQCDEPPDGGSRDAWMLRGSLRRAP